MLFATGSSPISSLLTCRCSDLFFLRPIVIPLCQRLRLSWLLLAINLYYVRIGLIKGVGRIGLFMVFMGDSFFSPHVCVFPVYRHVERRPRRVLGGRRRGE